MNEVVDRLRDAAGAVGRTVQHVPPFRPRPFRTRRSWVVPLAAAAAVTAVAAAGVMVVQGDGLRDGVVAPTAPAPTSAAGPEPGADPEYFAVTGGDGLRFYRADTGQRAGRRSPRTPEERFSLVDSARGVFYTVLTTGPCEHRFVRLTAARPGEAPLTEQLLNEPPRGTVPTSLAVSADGGTLAYGLSSCGAGVSAVPRLGVTDLATGESRIFGSPGGDEVRNVSVTADGRFVAFQRHPSGRVQVTGPSNSPVPTVIPETPAWSPTAAPVAPPTWSDPGPGTPTVVPPTPDAPPAGAPGPAVTPAPGPVVTGTPLPGATEVLERNGPTAIFEIAPDPSEIWVLDTDEAGDDLDRARRVRLGTASGVPAGVHGARIDADGRSFVAALGRIGLKADGDRLSVVPGTAEIVRFDADGGRPAVLYRDDRGGFRLVDADGSGGRLVVRRGTEFGVVDSGRYRTLRNFPGTDGLNIGW
ncbi:hypothetical protein [Streptosporangium sp. NPDC002524]|uniref:hypothetical protein n=1 Tax=Streptosporangium sp. NPDC002524 TaxID=3154537 RepID=UPI00332A8EDB